MMHYVPGIEADIPDVAYKIFDLLTLALASLLAFITAISSVKNELSNYKLRGKMS